MKADFLTAGRLFTVLLLWFVVLRLDAQAVSYNYDFSGNRISRQVITLSSPSQGARSQPADSVTVVATIGERTVSIYPNPTKGVLMIELKGLENRQEATILTVYDSKGMLIVTMPVQNGINPLDMTVFPSGWYILRIQGNEGWKEYKIIKQ
ncbi:MAG: T9SS type A sorting domain-containing protein [Bacteroidales bacterium]|jgi:hypothetical protein|nr:T9SS type A sorting domain-containing protein [Bacteroidales bacterium]